MYVDDRRRRPIARRGPKARKETSKKVTMLIVAVLQRARACHRLSQSMAAARQMTPVKLAVVFS